jgi:hypothetical protein
MKCKVLRNVGILPDHYTASESRRPGLDLHRCENVKPLSTNITLSKLHTETGESCSQTKSVFICVHFLQSTEEFVPMLRLILYTVTLLSCQGPCPRAAEQCHKNLHRLNT